MDSVLKRALELAEQGLAVFPCKYDDKTPYTNNGFYDATSNPLEIKRFLWAERLIGVRTGAASGISVIDVDIKDGVAGDVWLDKNFDRLPKTRVHQTRSGGLHIIYKHLDGVECSAGKIALGIDTRGDGGYIIWWPADGYPVLDDMPLDRLPIYPDWPRPPPGLPRERGEPGTIVAIGGAVQRLVDFIADSHNGERNSRMHWAVCRLQEMWFAEPSYRENAIQKLEAAALAIGLTEREVRRTFDSVLRK